MYLRWADVTLLIHEFELSKGDMLYLRAQNDDVWVLLKNFFRSQNDSYE